MSKVDWAAWRKEFPGLAEKTYLNTVSLGQLSRRSREAVNRFLDLWTSMGASAWYKYWLDEVDALRGEFAQVIGADKDEIAIMPNVSSALAAISSSLDYGERNRVVSCDMDFPTLTYHWLAQARQGVEVDILPSPDNISMPVEAFAEAVDHRTALIATSRVFFTSGYIQDVKALAEVAHQAGALCLIDDYQGTGQVPIDVKDAGVDVLITGGLKWLMGGPGVAFLYVRRELIPLLTPSISGWFAHRRQFDFDPNSMEYRDDARRFEAGTPAVAAVFAARAGLEIVNQIGPEALRQRTASLNQDLVSLLKERGYTLRIPPDPDQHASITIVEAENPMEITKQLAAQNIVVDKRPGAVRVSPYFYNTFEENQIFLNALDEIVRG